MVRNYFAAAIIAATLFLCLVSRVNAKENRSEASPSPEPNNPSRTWANRLPTKERSRRSYGLCPHPQSTAFAWDC